MTEIGESISVNALVDEEWDCPCTHKEEKEVSNQLDNNGQTLGKNMANGEGTDVQNRKVDKDPKPSYHAEEPVDITKSGYKLKVKVAAHHLIPGGASLPNSDIMEFVSASRGTIKSDIGYDINGADNGIWLPGNYGVVDWGKLTMPYKGTPKAEDIQNEQLQAEYAYAAMDKSNTQFHDAHGDYNAFVIKALNKIHVRAGTAIAWCEECRKSDKISPPYKLIKRLNGLSSRLRNFLVYPPGKWRLPIFTSIWSLRLKANESLNGKA